MNNAGLPLREKSLAAACCHKSSKFEGASANMRCLLGSRAGGVRQDALFSEDAAGSLASDEDLEAFAAYKKAKKQGRVRKSRRGSPDVVGVKCERAGRH